MDKIGNNMFINTVQMHKNKGLLSTEGDICEEIKKKTRPGLPELVSFLY